MSLRDRLIEQLSFFCGPSNAPEALDAVLAVLSEYATPLTPPFGLSGAMYVDDQPSDATLWVIDLAVLQGEPDA
jgi:hypothetical protein